MAALPSEPVPALPAAPVLPQLALAAYLVCVAGAGVLANVAVVAALFRRKRSAFHSIVMQLAASDALLLCGAAGFETWARNEGTWSFGGGACVAYLGCEALASAASAYFAVTLALHALATAGLEAEAQARGRDDDSDAETRSSRRSLVESSTPPPRALSVDYRIANAAVPVAVPIAFVWVLAASLSVPEFALATTLRLGSGLTLCTFADPTHRLDVHSLLAAFGLLLPVTLLTAAGSLAARELRGRRKAAGEGEARPALVLSVCLAAVYLVLCAPRSALATYGAYAAPQQAGGYGHPLLSDAAAPPAVGLALSCLSYAAALLRPLLYVVVFPDLRRSFSFTGSTRAS